MVAAAPSTVNRPRPSALNVMVTDIRDQYAQALEVLLGPHGFVIHRVTSGGEAIWMVQRRAVDAAVLDDELPDMSGVRALRMIRTMNRRLPIILVGRQAADPAQDHLLRSALELEALSVLAEPVDLELLLGQMARLFESFFGQFRGPEPADPAQEPEPTRSPQEPEPPGGPTLRFRKRG